MTLIANVRGAMNNANGTCEYRGRPVSVVTEGSAL